MDVVEALAFALGIALVMGMSSMAVVLLLRESMRDRKEKRDGKRAGGE